MSAASGSCLWSQNNVTSRLESCWKFYEVHIVCMCFCLFSSLSTLPVCLCLCSVQFAHSIDTVRVMTLVGVARWVHDYLFMLFKEVAIYTTCCFEGFFFETHFADDSHMDTHDCEMMNTKSWEYSKTDRPIIHSIRQLGNWRPTTIGTLFGQFIKIAHHHR